MNSSDNSTTVLVAGATGYLGGEICRQLTAQIRSVKGLVRSTSNSDKVAHLQERLKWSLSNYFNRFFHFIKAKWRFYSNGR